VRSVKADLSALRLIPSDGDLAALHADGYLGEVIVELRDRQSVPEGETRGEIAGHALGILAGILAERQAAEAEIAA
jgi:hypothetical protein